MAVPKKSVKLRIFLLMAGFVFILFLLVLRVGYWQIIRGAELKKIAEARQTKDTPIAPIRGTIYDRNGKELAVSATAYTVAVQPTAVEDAEILAKGLSEILELEYDEVYQKVTQKSNYVRIARKVDVTTVDKIRELRTSSDTKEYYSAVILEEDSKRYYTDGLLAPQLIGFTGDDGQGLYGIEKTFEDVLTGVSGRIVSAKNGAGVEMGFRYEEKYDSVDGTNIVLTIDETIQRFAQTYLEQAVLETNPECGAFAIVIAPKTGEILAMAVSPGYDMNSPFAIMSQKDIEELANMPDGEEKTKAKSAMLTAQWRNKAVSDIYEPGSVFKIITAAMALEENVISANNAFYCPGYNVVGGHRISCWKTAGHGAQTFKDGLANSCNPVFMEAGARLGVDNFYNYFKAFGFTENTGFDVIGEGGSLYYTNENMHEVELATSSFGQGFSVTPLQMVSAVSAVVNGGKLIKPHVVKAFTDSDGNIIKSFEPEVVRQVISEKTSKTMREYLENVVANGTGKSARIEGYRIGGKTGTSEKQPRNNGKYVASFVGVAPADDPEILCLVAIDEPTGALYQGSQIAAPVARNIMEASLRYLHIPKQTEDGKELLSKEVTGVRNLTLAEAEKRLRDEGFEVKVKGDGDKVLEQMPAPGGLLASGGTVILYTENAKVENVYVPDLTGLSPQTAKQRLEEIGLNIEILGASLYDGSNSPAFRQEPQAGETVKPATTVRVEFRYMDGD